MLSTRSDFKVGDRELTEMYQFVDPLRGSVPIDQRTDLGNHPKHNGGVTFLPMPSIWDLPKGFEDMLGSDDPSTNLLHETFHRILRNENNIHSLAFSLDTMNHFLDLVDLSEATGETLVMELSVELMPIKENPYVGRKHGAQGTYVSGCRGPLCKVANTQAQRARYGVEETSIERQKYEATINGLTDSYAAYISYIKCIMKYRRALERQDGVAYRHWHTLNLAMSVLVDATDESFAL